MNINAITAAIILTASSALGAGLSSTTVNRLADAIYRVEGGARAKAPYGILSIKVSSTDEARRICINTIRNNHSRWIRAGRPGEYLDFLADRYCPPSADPRGNRNWKKNVRSISGLDF
jgi:hypothetical protein